MEKPKKRVTKEISKHASEFTVAPKKEAEHTHRAETTPPTKPQHQQVDSVKTKLLGQGDFGKAQHHPLQICQMHRSDSNGSYPQSNPLTANFGDSHPQM